jgi:hypothetical protein
MQTGEIERFQPGPDNGLLHACHVSASKRYRPTIPALY